MFSDCSLRVSLCLILIKNNAFEMINTLYQYFCALAVLEREIKYKSERLPLETKIKHYTKECISETRFHFVSSKTQQCRCDAVV